MFLQAVLTVPNVTESDKNLLCFVYEMGIVVIIPTKSIRNGEVICGTFTPRRARVIEFGVAASEDAAEDR